MMGREKAEVKKFLKAITDPKFIDAVLNVKLKPEAEQMIRAIHYKGCFICGNAATQNKGG